MSCSILVAPLLDLKNCIVVSLDSVSGRELPKRFILEGNSNLLAYAQSNIVSHFGCEWCS